MTQFDKDPQILGSEQLLSAAKNSAMRISAMYSNPQYKEVIQDIVADGASGEEYGLMLGGSEKGGKTGIQKWFEQELETIGRLSSPQDLRTYYARLKERIESLEAYIKRI